MSETSGHPEREDEGAQRAGEAEEEGGVRPGGPADRRRQTASTKSERLPLRFRWMSAPGLPASADRARTQRTPGCGISGGLRVRPRARRVR